MELLILMVLENSWEEFNKYLFMLTYIIWVIKYDKYDKNYIIYILQLNYF